MVHKSVAPWLHTVGFLAVAVLMTAAIGTSLLAGCQQANPPGAVADLEANTPEEKLEEVMIRLRAGVADASAAAGSGVVSQRTVSQKLIPPKGEQDKYRAEITIQTTISLARPPAAETTPKAGAEGEEAPAAGETGKEEAFDPYAEEEPEEKFIIRDDELAAAEEELQVPAASGVTQRVIEESRETTSETYELVYDNERWKLAEEISAEEDEVAKYLFEYALAE